MSDENVEIVRQLAEALQRGVPIRLRVVNILELRDGRLVRAYDASGPSQTLSQ